MATDTPQRKILSKVFAPIFGILLIMMAALYFIQSQLSAPQGENENSELTVGRVLPDFELAQVGGGTLPVSQLKAKVILINFWATWCHACIVEMPSIVKLRETYKSRGFEVAGINLDENPENVVPKAVKDLGINFPVFKDSDGKIADLFNVYAIPLTIIINHDRKILFVMDGEQDWNSSGMRSKLEQWLSE